MGSKRKTRKVRKADSETPVHVTSRPRSEDKPSSKEALIVRNGTLVEGLFSSEAWHEIVFPLILEMIASVSGRYTNGRFFKGSLTKNSDNLEGLAWYQCALEEFHNNLHDFVTAKDNLIESKKREVVEKDSAVYNPFMEEFDEENNVN